MPLGHQSTSHGIVPFGFFNIETDLLLLHDHFFFAQDFCGWVEEWAAHTGDLRETRSVWVISDPRARGNLTGAIRGVDHSGFIGAVYARYPFPRREELFSQNPEGHRTRNEMRALLTQWAGSPVAVPAAVEHSERRFRLGPYEFDRPGFASLLEYVERGGMPGWTRGTRPDYVTRMIEAASFSPGSLFSP